MKKGILFKCISVGLVILVGASLSGCAGGDKLTESDVIYAAPLVDNVLAGIKDNNYSEFARDMSDTAKSQVTQSNFGTLVNMLQTKIGDYESRTFSGASTVIQNNVVYTVIVYNAKYTKETASVLITVTLNDNNGKKQIDQFILNSPNLRKQ